MTEDDLPQAIDPDQARRDNFLWAVHMARAEHDPATDWQGFVEALWRGLYRTVHVVDDDSQLISSRLAAGEDPAAVFGELLS